MATGDTFGLVVSLVLLAVVLVVAVTNPHRPPESVVAVAAAAAVLVLGAVSLDDARDELSRLAPVLVFLVAVLVLGGGCAREGVFTALGAWLARSHSGAGSLLLSVFGVAAAVTSVLSLDATVVLLTPVVLTAAGSLGISARPYVYATGHVANTGSLLLPTGNLTNLLALSAAGLTLVHFTALMLLPWLLVLAIEYLVLRRYFREDLAAPLQEVGDEDIPTPWFALVVLGLTLLGFVATSLIGIEAYWAAIGGAAVLAAHTLATGKGDLLGVAKSADVPFLLFVMGLAVVVRAAVENGLGDAVDHLVPTRSSFFALLLTAAIAMVMANLVNNLPALLILLPSAAAVGQLAVLAVLIGVNVGPNLSYPGSLATLLWRRVLRTHGIVPSLRRFTILGLLTAPACVVAAVAGLWLAGQV